MESTESTSARARHELNDLKKDVSHKIQKTVTDGARRVEKTKKTAGRKFLRMRLLGFRKMKQVESSIKAKPGQSVAIAFLAGALTSFLAIDSRKD